MTEPMTALATVKGGTDGGTIDATNADPVPGRESVDNAETALKVMLGPVGGK